VIDLTKTNPEASSQSLSVKTIFIKESQFERVAQGSDDTPPQFDTELGINVYPLGTAQEFETTLSLRVIGKQQKQTLYTIKLTQAGQYVIKGFDEEQLKQILNGVCINQLYPYACQHINNLLLNGGFPAITLAPVNFEALYQQNQANTQQEARNKKAAKAPIPNRSTAQPKEAVLN